MIINENNQKDQEVQITQISVTQDEEIQTDCTLSRNSPRKIILKKKIHSLQKKLRKVQKQLIEQKASSTKNFKKPSLLEYCDATDQLLPPSIAFFVKAQLHLSQKLSKGRKYSIEFKKMCLSLYLSGSKTYEVLSKQFCLPSTRSLRRMVENFKIRNID